MQNTSNINEIFTNSTLFYQFSDEGVIQISCKIQTALLKYLQSIPHYLLNIIKQFSIISIRNLQPCNKPYRCINCTSISKQIYCHPAMLRANICSIAIFISLGYISIVEFDLCMGILWYYYQLTAKSLIDCIKFSLNQPSMLIIQSFYGTKHFIWVSRPIRIFI